MLIVKVPSLPGSNQVFNISVCDKVRPLLDTEGRVIGLSLVHFGAREGNNETFEENIIFDAEITSAYVEFAGQTVAYYYAGKKAILGNAPS